MGVSSLMYMFLVGCGSLVAISSSWPVNWAGLEVSTLGLLPLMVSLGSMGEVRVVYFVVQICASVVLLVGGSFSLPALFGMSLVTKLGVFPCHFWVIKVFSGVSPKLGIIMLSVMKVSPLALLVPVLAEWGMFLLAGVASSVAGALLGLNETSLMGMIGASSVAHSGWLLLGGYSGGVWFYMVVYSFVLALVFQMPSVGLVFLSGLPPSPLFFAKLLVLQLGMDSGLVIYLVPLLMSSVLSLVYYLKFTYQSWV